MNYILIEYHNMYLYMNKAVQVCSPFVLDDFDENKKIRTEILGTILSVHGGDLHLMSLSSLTSAICRFVTSRPTS
jgi:hypothetical protein